MGYLFYTYAVFAFDAVLNPATPLYIAVVGLAVWSLAGLMPRIAEAEVEATVGNHLRRRASGIFLLVIAATFALLWLAQIGSAAITGQQPQALRDAGWPTSPIYVLDLAFLIPLSALTGIRLLSGRRGALRYAVPLLVFIPVLTLGVLSITVFAVLGGQPLDFVQPGCSLPGSPRTATQTATQRKPASSSAALGRWCGREACTSWRRSSGR